MKMLRLEKQNIDLKMNDQIIQETKIKGIRFGEKEAHSAGYREEHQVSHPAESTGCAEFCQDYSNEQKK